MLNITLSKRLLQFLRTKWVYEQRFWKNSHSCLYLLVSKSINCQAQLFEKMHQKVI